MTCDPDTLDTVATRLRAALQRPAGLAVLTGAGMSAESGIPTFRDAMSGLWSQFDPAQLASEDGFRADPGRVWRWYAERRHGVRGAEPNAGHQALGDLNRRHPGAMTLITQNVDDLHQRSGVPETIRLHGDILADRWLMPCRRHPPCRPAQARAGTPPHCAECGNLVRPGVVWFGEALPSAALESAQEAMGHCELLLVVGTSGAVWPAAGLAGQARRYGATVVIVNPDATEIDDEAHILLRGTAATVLPALRDRVLV